MNDLKVNQEFKNLIPALTEEERTELEKSILMFGCRDKIITWNNTIIDGHNRYEICTKNSVEFEVLTMDYDFENDEEVKQWIIKNQFARRNISIYQRSVLALQLKESISKKAKDNLSTGGTRHEGNQYTRKMEGCQKSDKVPNVNINGVPCRSSDKTISEDNKHKHDESIPFSIDTKKELAKIAGVSHDTIHKVEAIEKEAPEVIKEAAKENVISINKAYNITKEIKNLEEEEKKSKAEELLNQQYQEKAKQIDKEKKIADKIADVIYGVLVLAIDEEKIGHYLEYSPKEPLEKHIERCDQAIQKMEEIKKIFANMKKIKVVK